MKKWTNQMALKLCLVVDLWMAKIVQRHGLLTNQTIHEYKPKMLLIFSF